MKTYTYKGQSIARCERAEGEHKGRWVIWASHPATGIPYADELLTHRNTLADAREAIDEEKS